MSSPRSSRSIASPAVSDSYPNAHGFASEIITEVTQSVDHNGETVTDFMQREERQRMEPNGTLTSFAQASYADSTGRGESVLKGSRSDMYGPLHSWARVLGLNDYTKITENHKEERVFRNDATAPRNNWLYTAQDASLMHAQGQVMRCENQTRAEQNRHERALHGTSYPALTHTTTDTSYPTLTQTTAVY